MGSCSQQNPFLSQPQPDRPRRHLCARSQTPGKVVNRAHAAALPSLHSSPASAKSWKSIPQLHQCLVLATVFKSIFICCVWQTESGTQENAPAPQGWERWVWTRQHLWRVAGGLEHVRRWSATREPHAVRTSAPRLCLRAMRRAWTGQGARGQQPSPGFTHANRHNGFIRKLSMNLPSREHLQENRAQNSLMAGHHRACFLAPSSTSLKMKRNIISLKLWVQN